jgi:murein DD-endopeptidase MepM/ murein hydrolase activator NlpD
MLMRWLALATFLSIALAAPSASAQRGTYVVRSGDTLAEIARRHHVTIEALEQANTNVRAASLRPGARLWIPRARRGGIPARRHRVREGDTLARIARRYRVSIDDIRHANSLRNGTIRPGDTLWVPRQGVSPGEVRAAIRGENPVSETAPPPIDDATRDEAEARARELGLGATHVGQRLLRERADPRWIEAAGEFEATQGTLLLPVEGGDYLRGWGSGVLGYHLAIDIGAREGTDILAAERGIVAYAGHGIQGYGNLVILVHANRWITGYAHASRMLVVPGQIVERGQVIAEVGQTGYAQGPHLHFMFVHDGRHCDPLPLFRPHIARADGAEVETLDLVWDAERQPSGVQCLMRADRPHPYRNRPRRHRH